MYRVEDNLWIDEIVTQEANQEAVNHNPNGAAGVPLPHQGQHDQMNAMLANVQRMQAHTLQMHTQLEASIASLRQWGGVQFKQLNNNVR